MSKSSVWQAIDAGSPPYCKKHLENGLKSLHERIRKQFLRIPNKVLERLFSMRCAVFSPDDRLHCHDDRFHIRWTLQFTATKTVVMAVKTVVAETECRNPWEYPQILFHIPLLSPLFLWISDSTEVRLCRNVRNSGKKIDKRQAFFIIQAGCLYVRHEKYRSGV